MQPLQKILPLWIALVLLTGCASMQMPTTNLERFTAIEIAYKNIVDTATLHVMEGRLNNDQIDQLRLAFDQYEASRDIALIALELSEDGAFETQAQTMLTIITSLRTFVSEVEQ